MDVPDQHITVIHDIKKNEEGKLITPEESKKLTRPHSNSGDAFINIDNILQNRTHWVDSDEEFLKNKMKIVRAYRKLYSKAKYEYQLWKICITVISVLFAGLVPVINTINIAKLISNTTNNVINIIFGLMTVGIQIVSSVLDYGAQADSCSKIVTMCTDIEGDIQLVISTNKEDRANSVLVLKNIVNAYNSMLKRCTSITITNSIISKYKKEVIKEISDKQLPKNDEVVLLSLYLMPIGDSIIT